VHGPTPHSYDLKMNAKAKKAALKCVLSEKARGNQVVLLESFQLASHKTQELIGVMAKLGVSSKLNADWDFLVHLHEAGRTHADAWIAQNFDMLGNESTVDIRAQYL